MRLPYLFGIAQGSAGWIDAPRVGVAATGGVADPAEMMENAGMATPAPAGRAVAALEQHGGVSNARVARLPETARGPATHP